MSTVESGGVVESGEEHADGRRAKGERRRRAIIAATLRVVERDGVAGVSHRNIAREAGVPAASITYYFAGIDEVLVATLLDSVETLVVEMERLSAEVSGDESRRVSATAELLASLVNEHRERTVAEYELYLLAARRPALRPAARRWIEAASGCLGGSDDDPVAVRALLAAVDGMLMHALIAEEPPGSGEFEPALRYLMSPLRQHTIG